tara:strand:- start:1303 stop:1620 length:318 start_codon:yes stop_codon:yes gene_type:complete
MSEENYNIWSEVEETWNTADYSWNELRIAIDVIGGGGYSRQLDRLKKRSVEDQKTFIKLICKINGEEYNQSKWTRPNVNVNVSHMRIVEKFLTKPEIKVFINKNN